MSAWLTQNRNAITVSGNVKDIAYILSECTNFPKIIIIDIPRSNEQGHISYSLIEQLKKLVCYALLNIKAVLLPSIYLM